jgi:hypothetical protein
MPNPGARSPIASLEGEEPSFCFTEHDWDSIERKYASPIPTSARARLQEICNQYLASVHFENSAARISEVTKYAKVLQREFGPFFRFCHGEHIKAERFSKLEGFLFEFDHRFDAELKRREVRQLQRRRLKAIRLDRDIIMQFAIEFGVALAIVAREKTNERYYPGNPGFVPGNAFKFLLRSVRDWAKVNKLPRVTRSHNGQAGPLSRLVFALNKRFPEPYRERQLNSPYAVTQRYRRLPRGPNARPK